MKDRLERKQFFEKGHDFQRSYDQKKLADIRIKDIKISVDYKGIKNKFITQLNPMIR